MAEIYSRRAAEVFMKPSRPAVYFSPFLTFSMLFFYLLFPPPIWRAFSLNFLPLLFLLAAL